MLQACLKAGYATFVDIRPSVRLFVVRPVVISKTKQGRPIVALQHYIYVESLILLLHSDPPRHTVGRYSGFKYKYVLFDLATDHSCCQQSVAVGNCRSQSSSVVLTTPKSIRRPASYCSGDILVLKKIGRRVRSQTSRMQANLSFIDNTLHA